MRNNVGATMGAGLEETAHTLLSADEYLLDISALRLLPQISLANEEDAPRILVASSLHAVLGSDDAQGQAELIAELIGAQGRNALALSHDIAAAYASLLADGRVEVVQDESPRLLAQSSGQAMLEAPPVLQLAEAPAQSARSREIAAANATTIMERSAGDGTPILMKNRSLPGSLRGRVTVVEIADRLESLVDDKQELTSRLFGRRHKKTVKFFVGAVIAVGGIWVAPLGIAGAVLAFVDP